MRNMRQVILEALRDPVGTFIFGVLLTILFIGVSTSLTFYDLSECLEFELLKNNVEDGYTVVLHNGMVYVLENARFYGTPMASGHLKRSTVNNSPIGD
jgi:hypothetical protein